MAQRKLEVVFLGDAGGLKTATDEVGGKLDGLSSKLGGIGKAAAIGFAAVSAAGIGAAAGLFKVGESFDKAFDTIAVGTGATGDALDGLNSSFKRVFTSVPTDMNSAAMAIADLNTRTGASGEALEMLSKQMLEMTRITGGDLSSNIQSVTRLMGDWGIAANEDGVDAMDKLFVASQATGIGIDKLSNQMVQFGAPLRQLGFGFETSAALLAKFEKEGVNAELVLGSLRVALGKMAKAGEPAEETLARTVEAIKNAGSASEANAIALELFGARAGPDMAAAIREGRFAVDDLVAMMNDSAGAVSETAARTADFGEKWTLFKNKVLAALEPLGTAIFGLASVILDKLTPPFESFLNWVVGTAAPALTSVLTPAFGLLGTGISKLMTLLEPLGGALAAAGQAFEDLTNYIRFAWVEGDSLNDFLANLPGWAQPAAKALGEMVVQLKAFDMGKLRSESASLVSAFQPAIDVLRPLAEDVLAALKDQFDAVSEALKPLMEAFAEWEPALEPLAKAIGTVLVAAIAAILVAIEAWVRVTTVVLVVAIKALTVAVEVVTAVVKALAPVVEDVASKVSSAVQSLWSKAQGPLNFVKEAIDKIGERAGVLAGTVGTIMGLAAAGFESFKNTVKPPIDAVIGAIQALIDAINKIPTPGDVIGKVGDLGGAAKGAVGKINPFASGTFSAPAGWALVGEEGPELVNLRGGERIYSAPETREVLGGGDVHLHFNGPTYMRDPEQARMVAADAGFMAAARRRGMSLGRA